MRFSIIIPVYNAESFLDKCLRSVLDQDYSDYEMLLINDGSTDRSGVMCREYAEKFPGRIQYVCQENAGPSGARNRGIQIARGEYLVFLDSDDAIEANSLARLESIICEKKADAIICGEKFVDLNGAEVVQPVTVLCAERICADKESALLELSEKRFPLLTHKFVVKRKIVTDNGLSFNPEYRIGEDIFFIAQVACACDTFALNESPHYIYNYNDASLMRTVSFEKIWCTTEICEDLYRLTEKKTEAQKRLLYTTISMLLIGFTKYYAGFDQEQKNKVKRWLNARRGLLKAAAQTHRLTNLAGKFIGAGNAFLLAGWAVSARK